MKVIHTISEMRQWRGNLGNPAALARTRLSFVPTMGALHEGHASLVTQARQRLGPTGCVASSIFVNPTQFGPNEDFTQYPRTLDSDADMLSQAGCDLLFIPSAAEMYGPSFPSPSTITINPGPLADLLEGAIRPGHFQGVCTVVLKLLHIVQPTELLLGQKDFQQQAILRKMCHDLNLPIDVITCPTIRESDGLAMSSRNRYLSPGERTRAAAIHEGLAAARTLYNHGERNALALESAIREKIEARDLLVQYAVAADPASLNLWNAAPNARITGPCVLLIAAKLGSTRLIDNWLLTP